MEAHMTSIPKKPATTGQLPDHMQLPCEDGTFVKNSREHPQSRILSDSLETVLRQLHPTGDYFIGQDCGIYWRQADPPERGAEASDWYLVPDVPPKLKGEQRRSYVLWQETLPPLIALEFVSGDGSEEHDCTPFQGKFWVYEKAIRAAFYGIFTARLPKFEAYHLVDNAYQPLPANARGHYEIGPLHVELGIWHGWIGNQEAHWLRWWDLDGNLLLAGWEELARERHDKEEALRLLEQAQRRAELLAERLRAAGLDPDAP
jgi:Uma2 family endonuclease